MCPVVLTTPDGDIELTSTASGKTQITLKPFVPTLYIPRITCETSHPEEVQLFLSFGTSFAWLCDTISRFEDQNEVQGVLERQLTAYVDPKDFRYSRILDFGCGAGASTLFMAAFLPDTEIIGVDLDPVRIELAERIAARRGTSNARFLLWPAGQVLPPGFGSFDYII